MEMMQAGAAEAFLREHGVSPERGFLPAHDPPTRLPDAFAPWEGVARGLPKLLAAGVAGQAIEALPLLDVAALEGEAELERAMLLLSYFGHAYVFETQPARGRIPAPVAVPWHQVAGRLGRPPVLAYASHTLYNWRRLAPDGPIALGNLARLENFLGGVDEDWFVLVHVAIEALAGPGLAAMVAAQDAAAAGDVDGVVRGLEGVAATLGRLVDTLGRMPERCDPYIYYHRVRQFIHGWKGNPDLPTGVVYEGVRAYGGHPQQFHGETGAQSSVIPAFDAALGLDHPDDELGGFMLVLRAYMPPRHRAFIAALEGRTSVREFVLRHRAAVPALVDAYNACIEANGSFRQKHLEYAGTYVFAQGQRSKANPTDVGTGGTPFMRYLKQHQRDLERYLIA